VQLYRSLLDQQFQMIMVIAVFPYQLRPLDTAGDNQFQFNQIDNRLGKIIPGSATERINRIGQDTGAGQDNNRQIVIKQFDRINYLHAIDVRHPQVGQNDIRLHRPDHADALATVTRLNHGKAAIFKKCRHTAADRLLVVYG